ncbi:MAG: hypothetical protein AAF720_14110 [Pseudomonadota bacterium]
MATDTLNTQKHGRVRTQVRCRKALSIGLSTALILFIAGCATSTPYVAASKGNGYGFSEQRIESNRYRIMFRGNSSTTRETVETFLLYRAAELTLINGFDHFVVIENDTEVRSNYSTTATNPAFFGQPAFFGRYGFGYGRYAFPYYAYGFGWGGPAFDTYTREITRYSAVAYVTMHKGPKPENNVQAFNAREVTENLGPVVLTGS